MEKQPLNGLIILNLDKFKLLKKSNLIDLSFGRSIFFVIPESYITMQLDVIVYIVYIFDKLLYYAKIDCMNLSKSSLINS